MGVDLNGCLKWSFKKGVCFMAKRKGTQERVLEAACRVFTEKGFGAATITEICTEADANVASVSYYFGGKEALYDAVWRHAFAEANRIFPVAANLPENPDLLDILRSFALAFLQRIFSEEAGGRFAKLLYREMASPTLALDQIATEALFPQLTFLEEPIRGRFGEAISEESLRLCLHSILGQCAFYNFSRPLRERVMGKKETTQEEIERIAEHIARFSLGGLEAIQARSEKGK